MLGAERQDGFEESSAYSGPSPMASETGGDAFDAPARGGAIPSVGGASDGDGDADGPTSAGGTSASDLAYGPLAGGGGELVAERVGVEDLEGPDQPMGPPQNLEGGKDDIAAQAAALPQLEDGAGGNTGVAGGKDRGSPVVLPEGDGGEAGPMDPELAASIGAAQDETRTAMAEAESESNRFKAEMAARRDKFDAEQHATMLESLKTMTPADKRSTLKEMGYPEKQVKKLKDAELDALISGKIESQQRQTRILGMTPEELATLSAERKIQHLVDLGIDKDDLDKAGKDRAVKLFDDAMALAHVPGQHQVKIKIKGGLLGKSWVVKINCDAEGNAEMTAEKKGGFLSKLWGWVKLALPIICMVLAPITAGASLIALAVYQAATAIAQGDWLGAIVGAATALAGVGALMIAKNAANAATAFVKIAQVAEKVKDVANAAKAAMAAVKAKNAGSLIGALAAGAGAFASASAGFAEKFSATMKKWAGKLESWSRIAKGGDTVAKGIKTKDPIAAIGGAFDTVAATVQAFGAKPEAPAGDTKPGETKPGETKPGAAPVSPVVAALQTASKVTGLVNAGRKALQSEPPNYVAVADAALGIAAALDQDRRIEDVRKIVGAANRLKSAYDKRDKDPAALIAAALDLAAAVQVAQYDFTHEQTKGPDGKPIADPERDKIGKDEATTAKVLRTASTLYAATQKQPRPDYAGALAAAGELAADLTDNNYIDHASALTTAIDTWTKAVNSKDEGAIEAAAKGVANAIRQVHTDVKAIIEARGKEKVKDLPTDSASDQAYGKDPMYREVAQRAFASLSSQQQRLIEEVDPCFTGPEIWSDLDPALRQGFLNITRVLVDNGFPLDQLKLLPITWKTNSGIQQDRLLFTKESAEALEVHVQRAIDERLARGDRGFLRDKIEEGLHQGMAKWGARQWVTINSMQVGGGDAGMFVDIDQFGPTTDVAGFIGHMFEVIRNKATGKPTNPFDVARDLDRRAQGRP
jgi:hypothetical protein